MSQQPLTDEVFRAIVVADLATLKERVEAIQYDLQGNGVKGLVRRVDELETFRSRVVGVLLFLVAVGGIVAAVVR